jgi:hypothetical protein
MERWRLRKEKLKANVIGYEEEDDKITYFVTAKIPEELLNKRDVIKKEINGKPTDVEVREIPKACKKTKATLSSVYQSKTRAYQPGQSIGPAGSISAGTLGLVGTRPEYSHPLLGALSYRIGDWMSAKFLIKAGVQITEVEVGVTNRHVAGEAGELVLQPGRLDGGRIADKIGQVIQHGKLKAYAPLDIAVFKIEDDRVYNWPVNMRDLKGKGIKVNRNPPMGSVKKSGRSSGLTYGKLVRKGVTVDVDMGKKYGMVEFKDVYEIDMSTGNPLLISGDSGSSVWNTDNELIGIGFAAGSRYSYVLPIGRILDEFNITV